MLYMDIINRLVTLNLIGARYVPELLYEKESIIHMGVG